MNKKREKRANRELEQRKARIERMGRLRDGTQKVSHEDEHEHEGLDDVDEYGYSLAFITEKYASLAHQTAGHVQLVHVTKKRDEELGVKIVGAKNVRNNWAFVSEIAKKSPAEKTKQLKVGGKLSYFLRKSHS